MRWDRLFAEIESQVGDEESLERDQLVEELLDGDWAETRWTDLLGGQVVLDVCGIGVVSGQVQRTSDHLIHLEEDRGEWLIDLAAVVAVHHSTARREDPGPIGAKLGWSQVFRQLSGEEVALTRRDRTVVHGQVDVVGADFVRLITAADRSISLPYRGLAGLRSR